MEQTVRLTLMIVQVTGVRMELLAWMELTRTIANAHLNGLVCKRGGLFSSVLHFSDFVSFHSNFHQ